jgi:hypothetical protein
VFLKNGGDVSFIVEYPKNIVDALRRGTVDYKVEDVKAKFQEPPFHALG